MVSCHCKSLCNLSFVTASSNCLSDASILQPSPQGLLGASHCCVSGRGRVHSSHLIGGDRGVREGEKCGEGTVRKGDGQASVWSQRPLFNSDMVSDL